MAPYVRESQWTRQLVSSYSTKLLPSAAHQFSLWIWAKNASSERPNFDANQGKSIQKLKSKSQFHCVLIVFCPFLYFQIKMFLKKWIKKRLRKCKDRCLRVNSDVSFIKRHRDVFKIFFFFLRKKDAPIPMDDLFKVWKKRLKYNTDPESSLTLSRLDEFSWWTKNTNLYPTARQPELLILH